MKIAVIGFSGSGKSTLARKLAKNLPMHLFCANTEEDVRLFIEKGADLITANDPVPLLKVLGRI